MKKINRLIVLLLLAVLMPALAMAQGMEQLPLDPDVRYGKLPNGLTYYIRHNEQPKGEADFYIAQKVGSILEEDNQRGLAHFLEHMCFNGTQNFPGNGVIDWCERNGIKFGYNLNAYTATDQTVYMIKSVPTARVGVQDSVLLILHDWADGLTLDPEEIDKERGVIHEEWRTTNVGSMRILTDLLPVIYPGSKYGYRLPIGTMEVVDNFEPQALRDYYEKWYRPDQQGIIVVGDIDVDRIEGKIKEYFSPIQMPDSVAPREYFPVPDHEGTIYAIGHDPEMTNTVGYIMFLSDADPDEMNNTQMYYLTEFVKQMIDNMVNQRLSDLSRDPNALFASASVDFGDYLLARTKEAFEVEVVAKDGPLEPALQQVYAEVYRALMGGFTETEYQRAVDEFLSGLEKMYNNRDSRKNGQFVQEYVNHFLKNEAAPGIETDYQLYKLIASQIPVAAVNQIAKQLITPGNRVVLVMTPDNADGVYPTEESLAAVITAVESAPVEAYVDNVKTEPLIAKLPKPGKIKKVTEMPAFGAQQWTLSNGVNVIVKHTDFKADEIRFMAVANGGTNVWPDSYANSILYLPIALSNMGLGTYTNADLEKYLQGKQVSVNLSVDDYTRDISGNTTPKDLPTMMELIYMNFVDPTLDATEFDALQQQVVGILANQMSNPQFVFSCKIREAMFDGSPRKANLTSEIAAAATREQSLEMIKQAVANAADYTFIFVGNYDEAALKDLVCRYIATLPADAKKATGSKMPEFISTNAFKGGTGIDTFTTDMTTPQTWVLVNEWANLPYTPKDKLLASVAGQILTQRLLESVREREGAVYSIGAQGSMYRVSPNNTVIQSGFPMKPEKRDLVLGIISQEFKNMEGDIKPEELQKVQEYMVKQYRADCEENSDWLGWIGGWLRNGVDTYTGYEDLVNSLTPADVQEFMKRINAAGNYRVVLLEPTVIPEPEAPAAE